jgi:lipoprotein signal peptidase
VRIAALILFATAILVATVDLAHKASVDALYFHARSSGYVVLVLGLAATWAGAILTTRSPSMSLGGGVLMGGALGNVASLALWPGVPNPIEFGPIAFNLADVFVLAGFLLTSAAALALAARDSDRLYQPVRLSSRRAR